MTRTVYRTSVRALVEFIFRSGDIDNRISQTESLKAMQEGSRIHRMIQASASEDYHAEVVLSWKESYVNYDLELDGRADGIITGMSAAAAAGQAAAAGTGHGSAAESRQAAEPGSGEGADPLSSSDIAAEDFPQITVMIDEIKSTSEPLKNIKEPIFIHLAQAKCYAYIYAEQSALDAVGVQLTYVHVESEEKKRARRRQKRSEAEPDEESWAQDSGGTIRRFQFFYTYEDLETWFSALINEYRKWLDYLWHWKQTRTASIKELPFPFPYREGQKDLATGVYRTIARKKTLFLQAPTGTGKTMAVLYPSVKAVGEGLADRIFYLTAKTETRQAAVNAFSILHDRGLQLKYVLLTAKEKMCLCDEMLCDPDHCPCAKGHFDRINNVVYELLQRDISFDRQSILDAAAAFKVCPFELSLDLTDWTDAIIGDYNYVFDPRVKLRRYFADGKTGEYLFLVDEAHNLVDRAREMYSAQLVKEDFLRVRRILRPVSRRAERLLNTVNKALLNMRRRMEESTAVHASPLPARRDAASISICSSIGDLDLSLLRLQDVLDEILREHREFKDRDQVQELYFNISRFLMILDLVDENYITYAQITPDDRFLLRLFCVNPAQNLQRCCDSGVSTILFSATLLPVRYYINLLSKEENPYAMYAKSSFRNDQKLLLIARDVSSKYTRRSPAEYARVAEYLYCMVAGRRGNYIAFFPSYRVMEEVYAQFAAMMGSDDAGVAAAYDMTPTEEMQTHSAPLSEELIYTGSETGNHKGTAQNGKNAKNGIEILIQKSRMTPAERETFLEAFAQPRDGSLLAFCVMGGIFSEGIDLKGEQLIGAAIYGTGIPQINAELSLVQDYYNQKEMDGFAYACQYPGMNKVQQAAGRVIRTAADRGVILLLDERFLRSDYRNLFPREWADYQVTDITRAGRQIADFWQRADN